jgi:hypothetical protein
VQVRPHSNPTIKQEELREAVSTSLKSWPDPVSNPRYASHSAAIYHKATTTGLSLLLLLLLLWLPA